MTVEESVIIRSADPASADCRSMIRELDALQESLYSSENNYLDSIDELRKPNCYFLAAYLGNEIVGCGALKIVDGKYGELKRMYVAASQRKRGIGQKLLQALELRCALSGVNLIRLETGARQPEALALYRRNGYKEIGAFGCYAESASNVFMEKCIQVD